MELQCVVYADWDSMIWSLVGSTLLNKCQSHVESRQRLTFPLPIQVVALKHGAKSPYASYKHVKEQLITLTPRPYFPVRELEWIIMTDISNNYCIKTAI